MSDVRELAIVWDRGDGMVLVTVPAWRFLESLDRDSQGSLTDAEKMEIVARRACDGMPYVVLHKSQIPAHTREFREAWVLSDDNTKVVVDMPYARGLKLQGIRQERDKKLASLDVEELKALSGKESELAEVRKWKQQLRDLPTTVTTDLNAIETPEALSTFRPCELD